MTDNPHRSPRAPQPTPPHAVDGLQDPAEMLRSQLDERLRECARLIEAGVTVMDVGTTYVQPGIRVGRTTVIYPNTTIAGDTVIGKRCRIGPNTIIVDSNIGDDCEVFASIVEEAVLESNVDVGPFSHLRPGAHLEPGVHVGNFVEIKKSRLGAGTKAGHFSYIGDAEVGEEVNVGAGMVTCNFDGAKKNRTVIGANVFVGSGTMLVAPLRVGDRASTGAGSVVNRDVPAGALVAGVPARTVRRVTSARRHRRERKKDG